MSKIQRKCGPDAVDEYDDQPGLNSSGKCIVHIVKGNGCIEKCDTAFPLAQSNYYEKIIIECGIVELNDGCLSHYNFCEVYLPDSLKIIGNNCFQNSRISSIKLPEGLECIGTSNFPSTLRSIHIPSTLKDFPMDNLHHCSSMLTITVDERNPSYRVKDGILYDKNLTKALYCPKEKTGWVLIPNTVKIIGESCFRDCKKLTKLSIPNSVERIEDFALSGITLDTLCIPNSVTNIGKSCFYNTQIKVNFRISQRVLNLPDHCFFLAYIPHTKFSEHLETIGEECFSSQRNNNLLPKVLRLFKVQDIRTYAFRQQKEIKTIELYSCIRNISENAFADTYENLIIKCFSFVPPFLNDNAFIGMSPTAVLVVPKGCKVIYESVQPWSSFGSILEEDLDIDNDELAERVNDDILIKRLSSVQASKLNVNREYLRPYLQDLLMYFEAIESDEDYNEACKLIRYNRAFCPAIIEDMESQMCANWNTKYKLRLCSEFVFNMTAPIQISHNQEANSFVPQQIAENSPLLNLNITPEPLTYKDVNVRFTDILNLLLDSINQAQVSVKAAVAWFTNFSLYKQLLDLLNKGIKVVLLINNDLINNGGYCLDFDKLIDAGAELHIVEYPNLLHHKFCIIDDDKVISGSYNWTRFSSKNHENVIVLSTKDIVDDFIEEFDHLLQVYPKVDAMPEIVKVRPEYDRSAFKQYITEELDLQAREESDERNKITALHNAYKLNKEYLEKIDPHVSKKYTDHFEILDQSDKLRSNVVENLSGHKLSNVDLSTNGSNSVTTLSEQPTSQYSQGCTSLTLKEEQQIISAIISSSVYLALDISGSMKNTYLSGHVLAISKRVLASAIAISSNRNIALWTFGDNSEQKGLIDITDFGLLNTISWKEQGTYLSRFTSKVTSSLGPNALVIILTDDDGSSINGAISDMKSSKSVFWQIISYESSCKNIASAINELDNVSLATLHDYESKSEKELDDIILKDYLNWRKSK